MKLKSVILLFLFSSVIYSQTDLIPIKIIFDSPSFPPQFSDMDLEIDSDSSAQTSSHGKRKFLIGAHTGYRFNLDSYPILNSNLFFGFSLQIPLSDFVSIQPELNIWTSNFSDSLVIKEYSVIDIPLLLVFNILDGSSGVDFSIGPGIGILNTQSEKLISLNIGVAYWVDIVENICWTAISRLQIGGTINPGGGNSVSSLYLRMGLKYELGN